MFRTSESGQCPLCRGPRADRKTDDEHDIAQLACLTCGTHRFATSSLEQVDVVAGDDSARARLAHGVAKYRDDEFISWETMEDLVTTELPSALERIDNLVLHFGAKVEPGHAIDLDPSHLVAQIGCNGIAAATWVIKQATSLGYVTLDGNRGLGYLAAAGWKYFNELKRRGTGSTHAFMAMEYSDLELEAVFAQHLVPAVAATGFTLRKANDPHQPAGSIDDTMRADIRTSRFIVCDLTHGNRGAYWEAGFAEGIGRPVIYVCKAEILTNDKHPAHPHFDTRQQLIVPWDLADMAPAVKKLKAAIRATLPDEARMTD